MRLSSRRMFQTVVEAIVAESWYSGQKTRLKRGKIRPGLRPGRGAVGVFGENILARRKTHFFHRLTANFEGSYCEDIAEECYAANDIVRQPQTL
jgi:hypothetical protein